MTIHAEADGSDHTEPSAEHFQPDIAEQAAGQAPVLIPEQEVLLGTAAALPPHPVTPAKWWTAALWWITGPHRLVAAVPSLHRPGLPPHREAVRKHYPRRSPSYFDHSLISREGNRL